MKLVEFLIVFIIFPRICQSQKAKNNAKNKSRNDPQRMKEIKNSFETFSECLSMDKFKNNDVLRTVQLCHSLSTIEKVNPLPKNGLKDTPLIREFDLNSVYKLILGHRIKK